MKIFKTILILIVLFGLPAGSWYFLKDGLDWRKEKMESLKPQGKFFDAYSFTNKDKTLIFEQASNKTTVFKINNDMDKNDMALVEQFRKVKSFMFIILTTNPTISGEFSSKVPIRYIDVSTLSPNNYEHNSAQYMLVDTAGVIRSIYPWDMKEKFKKLTEDIAVVLPRRQSPDIVTKDTGNNN